MIPAAMFQEGPVKAGDLWAIMLVVLIYGFLVVGRWRVFEKAGEPGLASIVPIYDMIVTLRITGRPMWWIILLFVPIVNFIAWMIINLNLAWRFGKDLGYAFGLTLLPFVFFPILGFGDARYSAGKGPPRRSGVPWD